MNHGGLLNLRIMALQLHIRDTRLAAMFSVAQQLSNWITALLNVIGLVDGDKASEWRVVRQPYAADAHPLAP